MECQGRPLAGVQLLAKVQSPVDQVDLRRMRAQIQEHITEDQRQQKERYDRTRRAAPRYEINDLVMLRITSKVATGVSRKLNPKFRGPFRIKAILPKDRYLVEDLREGHKRVDTVVSPDHMKKWVVFQDDEQDEVISI